jgi:hypothetical protein
MTIIGWFTTMTMIRNILIITVIAALVPTAMSSVSASADAEIALFSRASVDTDSLSITGNGDSAKMELKATNDDDKSNRVSDFQLTADNVLSTEVGDKVTVKDNVDFTKAVTTDARNNQKPITITSNGVIDFAGYNQGVYTLDVVVDDDRAYEAIIAIGYQTNQIVDKEITRVNSEYGIEFVFPPIKDPPKCDEGEKLIDGECQPVCPEGEELIDGKCVPKCDPPGQLIDGQCVFDPGWCPVECDEYPVPPIEPEPEPIECDEGEELVDGQCVSLDTNPVEPIDPVPIGDEDENSDDEFNLSEGDSDESEDKETNEDESGESEDESENEDSGESEGESGEESEGESGEENN